jgi:hypothetical protein
VVALVCGCAGVLAHMTCLRSNAPHRRARRRRWHAEVEGRRTARQDVAFVCCVCSRAGGDCVLTIHSTAPIGEGSIQYVASQGDLDKVRLSSDSSVCLLSHCARAIDDRATHMTHSPLPRLMLVLTPRTRRCSSCWRAGASTSTVSTCTATRR